MQVLILRDEKGLSARIWKSVHVWQLTGPNLFAPLFLAKRIRIKQFGRLIST